MLRSTSWYAVVLVALLASGVSAQPRLDKYGDPLPDGALLRIGTTRLRAGSRIDTLAFTGDSKKLVTADRSSGIHVWDVATGKELRSLPCTNKDEPRWYEPSPFATILLSPTATHVAEVNNKSVCSVRDLATGNEVFRIDRQHWQNLCHLRFAPDGKTLALLRNSNGEATVYDVATGKLLHTLPDKHNAIYSFLAFSPDGRKLALAAQNIPVILYDVVTGKRLGEFSDAKDGAFYSGVFSPDGKLFAFLSKYARRLEVWDIATVKRLVSMDGPVGNSSPLTFSADSKWLIAAYGNSNLGIWEATTGKLVRTHTDRFGGFWHVAVSPDGKYLATTHGQIVELWDMQTGKPLHQFSGHAGHSVNVQFGRDSKTLISTSPGRVHGSDASAYVWDAATGKQLADVGWAGGDWPAGAVSADGRVQAQARTGEMIVVRELATKKILLQIDDPKFVTSHLALTPDGKRLLATRHEPISRGRFVVQLWAVDTGKKLLEHFEYGYADFDAGGRHLFIYTGSGQARKLQCYHADTGRPAPRTQMYVANHRVVLAPNGRLAAELYWDGTPVKLRELATGEVVAQFGGARVTPVEAAFSLDGRRLATGTSEGAILIWDVATGKELAHLRGHRATVRSLSWAPDGSRLATGGQDLTILVWDAKPWRVDAEAQKLTPRDLAELWDDLAAVKGSRGYQAVLALAQAPKDAVALLQKHLRPTTPEEMAKVRKLIGNLGDARFSVRTKAQLELEKLGELALPGLEKALAAPPTLETRLRVEIIRKKLIDTPPPPAQMQQLRALTVLEMIATAEAESLLDALARGEPESWLTQEARAAKQRLADGRSP